MKILTQYPVECSWRLAADQDDSAVCGLLHELTGPHLRELCRVSPEVCAACARWYPPTLEHINPTVASLLYTLSSRIAEQGGQPGCSGQRASELQELALSAIPHDYDATPVADQIDEQKNTGIADIGQMVPRPSRRFGPQVSEWAVAVTTAPRQQPTLDHCLSSLTAAGWTTPRIIADGAVSISPQWDHLPVTRRDPQMGAWPSYYLTLIELLMRQPHADAFLMVQDDVLFFRHAGLREYLESVLWPDRRGGIVAMYCSRAYAAPTFGWHQMSEPLLWGGPALIFSRDTVIQMISDPWIVQHRFSENDFGLANIDCLIGTWAHETEVPVYVSTPSLAQHIGHVSSLWKHSRAYVNRSAAAFAGSIDLGSPAEDRPALSEPKR